MPRLCAELLHSLSRGGVVGDARGGTPAGVQHGGVVAPAELACRSPAATRPVSSRARYMATCRGQAMRARSRGGEELLGGEAEVLAGRRLDLGDRPCEWRGRAAGRGGRGPPAASSAVSGRPVSELKATTRISAPSSARTLLSTRSAITSSASSSASCDVVVLGALAQDRQARGEVGRLDVGDEAGLEALAQAILERLQVVRRAVGGEHDLATAVVEGVEGVEELLLGLVLRSRNWTSSSSSTSTWRKRALKQSVCPSPSALRNSFVKASPVVSGRSGRGCGRAEGWRSS